MEESVEKSCWGITFWTVAIVVGLMVLVSLFAGGDTTAATSEAVQISS